MAASVKKVPGKGSAVAYTDFFKGNGKFGPNNPTTKPNAAARPSGSFAASAMRKPSFSKTSGPGGSVIPGKGADLSQDEKAEAIRRRLKGFGRMKKGAAKVGSKLKSRR